MRATLSHRKEKPPGVEPRRFVSYPEDLVEEADGEGGA
jgi:hypothetical protein